MSESAKMAQTAGSKSSFSSSTKRKNTLTLEEKIRVIKCAEESPSLGTRVLAEKFNCGRTQIQTILKNKSSIKVQFETHTPANRKRRRGVKYSGIDEAMFQWYSLARDSCFWCYASGRSTSHS